MSRKKRILVWTLLVLGTLIVLVGSLTVLGEAASSRHGVLGRDEHHTSRGRRRPPGALSLHRRSALHERRRRARLEERLPENLDGLAAPLWARSRARATGRRPVPPAPRVQELWEEVNRAAHEALLRLLEDDTRRRIDGRRHGHADLRTFVVNVGEELGFGEGSTPGSLPTRARSRSSNRMSSRLLRPA